MAATGLLSRYQAQGLTPPIVIRAGWKAWAIGLLAGPMMTGGGAAIGWFVGFPVNLIGWFAFLFFGLCSVLLGVALWRSLRGTGLARLSGDGLYLGTIGLTIPWRDIGPAYARATHHQGGRTVDVCFTLRRAAEHRARADALGRLQFWIAARTGEAAEGGTAEWAATTVMASQGVRQETPDGYTDPLSEARAVREADASAVLFTIPGAFLTAEDADALAEILTAESARRGG